MRPSLKLRYQNRLSVMPSLLGIVVVVMMLVGQSLAVGAVQSSDGAWIEICSGDGTKLVQTEGGTPLSDCAHCDFCTVQFSGVASGPSAPSLFGPAPIFARVQFVAVSAKAKPSAEQYWAANRGPPLTSEENMIPNIAQWAATINPVFRGASWL